MTEIWKDIAGFEGYYQISNLANVRRFGKSVNLKPYLNRGGYLIVKFTAIELGVRNKEFTIHRLLITNFSENPNNKPQVNHINGIKTDNRLENLEWCTPSENKVHAYQTGLWAPLKGIKSSLSKLTDKEVLKIRSTNFSRVTRKQIAGKYGVSCETIRNILTRKTWTHI